MTDPLKSGVLISKFNQMQMKSTLTKYEARKLSLVSSSDNSFPKMLLAFRQTKYVYLRIYTMVYGTYD
jgi:hypothetical protein